MKLYFAYGSNLSPRQMYSRCKSARLVSTARVDGHRLGFTHRSRAWGGGVADLILDPGAHVWGSLYELSLDDLGTLDSYEGVPHAYKRTRIDVVDSTGKRFSAWAYVVANKVAEEPPTRAYLSAIVDGAREVGLPTAYIHFLETIDSVPT